jgi:hypothetical protein
VFDRNSQLGSVEDHRRGSRDAFNHDFRGGNNENTSGQSAGWNHHYPAESSMRKVRANTVQTVGGVMRINVYAEELTSETEWITKKLEDGRVFYAVRLFLESSPKLHHGADDDRSAITFWVPWTKADGNKPEVLEAVAHELYGTAKRLREHIRSSKQSQWSA